MLSFRQSLSIMRPLTNGYSHYKTILCTNLRLCRNKNLIFRQRYDNNIHDRYKIDEAGNVKLQLDPKIEALQEKLIYCDYIERKRLKFGYRKNKAIESAFKKAVEARRNAEPIYSIALKYLKNNDTNNEAVEINENNEEKPLKPIHMPYSVTDQFATVKEKDETSSELPPVMPILNETYTNLYESYLTLKNTSGTSSQKTIKDLETRINELEVRRPADNMPNFQHNWMTDYEQYNDNVENDNIDGGGGGGDNYDEESWKSLYGTSNPDVPVSSTICGGCGALLQCQDSAIPGYLPFELFEGLSEEDLKSTICQRCHFMKNYNTTLEVTVPPEEYPKILSKIKSIKKKVAVILMIDLTDFPCSIWPDISSIIGKNTPIFVVGNKVDLLPQDCSKFLENVENSLMIALKKSGLESLNIKHVALISAKTGYGIERLINKLHKIWIYKGDIYMIGCTNVGKSTLFNALLQSDYCKVQAADLIQRATTSPWPGTTLNLLKFPILNPVRWRLYLRTMRLKTEREDNTAELTIRKRESQLKRDIKLATLQERVGRTFSNMMSNPAAIKNYENSRASGKFGINENNEIYKYSRWCYDTPGVIHPDQVLHLLTTEELLLTLPKKIISPRSFLFKPGQTIFLAGMGRIDLLNGPDYIRITVFASDKLPITICHTENADLIYKELLHTEALVVPINDPERLKIWPSLQSKEFSVQGISDRESAADVVLSSAGWVAITPNSNIEVTVRAWTPQGRGIHLRSPALLSKSISLRGRRIISSPTYECGRQVYIK